MAKEVLFNIRVDANFTKLVQLDQNMVKLVKRRNELIKLQKTENGLNAKQQKELTALNLTLSEQRKEKSRLTKEIQKGNKERAKEISQFQRETNLANRLNKRLKEVILTKGATSREARRLAKRLQTVQTRLKSVSSSAKQMTGSVGTARKGIGGFRASLATAAAGAAGMVGGVFALIGIFKSAVTVVTDFEQSLKQLGSITGLSGKGLDDLGDTAIKLSRRFGTSATDILKGFQLVGSASPELLKNADALAKVTANAEILALAGGVDLPTAAAALTKSMNQMGVGAERSAEFIDILATSQQKGTATISQLSDAFKNVGSILKVSNIDFEQGNVLLQGLAAGGLVGAEAGTKLRGVLLRLAKTGRDDLNPSTQNFNDILNVLSKEVTDVSSAQKLFGDENAAAALTLIDQRKVVENLSGALNEQGNALAQAKNNTDTVNGRAKILTASWEALILQMENGSGVMSDISKNILTDLSQGLNIIAGDSKGAKKEFSLFGTILTLLKTNFKILSGAIKIFLTPLRIMFDLIGKVINKFDFLRNAVNNTGDAFSNTTKIINNLPEIVDIVVEEIIESFSRIVDVARGLGIIFKNLFKIPPDLEQMKRGLAIAAEAIFNAFDDVTGDVADRVKKLFEEKGGLFTSIIDQVKNLGDQAGKDLGDSLAKGISKGLIENQSKIVSDLQKAISAATTEEDIIVLRAELELEQKELKRLQELGKREEITFQIKIDSELDKVIKDFNDKLSDEQQKIDPIKVEVKPEVKGLTEQEKQLLKDSAFQLGQEIADTAFNLQQQANERRKNLEIDQLTISDQRARDVLQSRLDSNLISQAEFESNRLALEQRTADEREQIEREAFERKKNLDTAQALINTALAITNALATTQPFIPVAIIAAATAAASGAVQVAQIRSQKFGGGGLLQGKSHAQGGIPGIVAGTTPVEMEGGEAIINKQSTRKHLPLLSAINRDGGGVPLMARGGLPVPSIKYQGGGVAGVNPIDIRAIVEETISGVTSTIRVENVASQTLDVALDVNNLESELSN